MSVDTKSIVGRAPQLQGLGDLVIRAKNGSGGAAFVVGEAGAGKSSLVTAASAAARAAGVLVLQGRCGGVGAIVPYRPFAEALLELARRGITPSESLGPYRMLLGRLVPEWADPGSQESTPPSAVLIGEALLRFLTSAGGGNGSLLVIEDLHESDPDTLAVVEYLVDNLPGQPGAFVGTVEEGGSRGRTLVRSLERRGTAAVFTLAPLTAADVRGLIATQFDVTEEHVPDDITRWLHADSGGNPYLVRELLDAGRRAGRLRLDSSGERLVGEAEMGVPAVVVQEIGAQIDRLEPDTTRLVQLAAVIGRRFPLSVLRACGAETGDLQSALDAQLIVPDDPAPDWYAFRHPRAAEAVRGGLAPLDRAERAGRAATAIETLHPELGDEWYPIVARLHREAGSADIAAELFERAGDTALRRGAPASAIDLYRSALESLPHAALERRSTILQSLLWVIGETGSFEQMTTLQPEVDELLVAGIGPGRRSRLYAQLAGLAHMSGRWEEGLTLINTARRVLGANPPGAQTASVDVIAAQLELARPDPERLAHAIRLAEAAAEAAVSSEQHDVACEAYQLLGVLDRRTDLTRSNDYFERARCLAEAHDLPVQRIFSEVLLGGTNMLVDGTTTQLELARAQAMRIGAIPLVYEVDGALALQRVLTGELDAADGLLQDSLAVATRLRLGRGIPYLLAVRAIWAAHRADRAQMEETLTRLEASGGADQLRSLTHGMARAVCALLEEDRDAAENELARAQVVDAENPSALSVASNAGLRVLLGVLARRSGGAHVEQLRSSAMGQTRWNQQFLLVADAVLLGREGRGSEAEAAMARALRSAGPYPMARHLALRLAAEPALRDGWGTPVPWLRTAEEFFHGADISYAASTCRGLLRANGASVAQRRAGSAQIPTELRSLGITTREYEVCQLLAEHAGNKAIGAKLFISPRTVEKHVASLLAKTGLADREALNTFARSHSVAG